MKIKLKKHLKQVPIQRVQKTAKEIEFETLFFFFNFAVVNGKLNDAEDFLSILRYEQDIDPQLFYSLDLNYQTRLQRLAIIVDNKIPTTRTTDIEESKNYYNIKKQSEDYVKKEKDIVQMIFESGQLNRFFNEDFRIESKEFKTEFGSVDLVAYDKDTVYPIEVKLNAGTHSIVSQIEKYMRHFWKRLSIKVWKNVIGIVIAQKFEKFALDEFKNLNVIPFAYSINNENIQFTKLGE